jgi:hypothetical protein
LFAETKILEKLRTILKEIKNDVVLKQISGKKYLESVKDERIEACREFLKQICKQSKKWHYDYPVWKGILKIKNDEVFMDYFIYCY